MEAVTINKRDSQTANRRNRFWKLFLQQKYLYMMSLPFVAWVFVFNYLPLWGWTMAFQNFKPGKGIFDQKWVGFDHFVRVVHR